MISGILLAGGKSKRMGTEKALLDFKGKKLFHYPLKVLEHFCDDIIISSSSVNLENLTDYPLVPDEEPGLGPVGGICSCLKKINNEHAIVLSCDIPFISVNYINYLLQFTAEANIVCGKNSEGYPEPLAGIYNRKVIPVLEKSIRENDYKMANILKKASVYSVDLPEEEFDARILFMNINTMDDFRQLDSSSE